MGGSSGSGKNLIGGVLGGMGASNQANATNAAGANALNLYRGQTTQAQMQNVLQALGSQGPEWLKANLPQDQYAQMFGTSADTIKASTDRMAAVQDQLSKLRVAPRGETKAARDARVAQTTSLSNEYKNLQSQVARGPTSGQYDLSAIQNTYKDQPGYLNQIETNAKNQTGILGGILNNYNADTSKLASLNSADVNRTRAQTGDLVANAQQFGKGRADIINRDAERGLKSANDTSYADMIGSGLGSSTLTQNAKAQNARAFGDVKQNALQNLSDSQVGQIANAKQFGYGQENAVQGAGRAQQASRMAGGTELSGNIAQQSFNIGQQSPMARQALFQSPTFNPFLGQNTTSYFPGLSSSGAFLGTLGNSVSAQGGAMNSKGKR